MEQLATGLNKAAETMATAEAVTETPEAEDEGQEVPDVASLKDPELFQLLEEAYSYKRPRDRQGKSEIFRVSRITQYRFRILEKNINNLWGIFKSPCVTCVLLEVISRGIIIDWKCTAR